MQLILKHYVLADILFLRCHFGFGYNHGPVFYFGGHLTLESSGIQANTVNRKNQSQVNFEVVSKTSKNKKI
jgi:hypothetical protein